MRLLSIPAGGAPRRRHRITRWTGAAIATATASVLLSSAVPAAAPPPQAFGLAARS